MRDEGCGLCYFVIACLDIAKLDPPSRNGKGQGIKRMIWRRFRSEEGAPKKYEGDLNAIRFIAETRRTIITVGSSFLPP